ncbi:MAG: N-acetyl-gamma-glutamyl-phosphate reductase [Acidobacteria bacterium]|nr:N-acetyl-gamma-glutamyl-phosphate reductase [Acidobacteriota bacterium]
MNLANGSSKIRVGILGGSGYGGSELLRLLLLHPAAEIRWVGAREHAGKPLAKVHPGLAHFTELVFCDGLPQGGLDDLDVLFLALPNGQAMEVVPEIPDAIKVIDLSGDFRLRDPELFARYYERTHACFHLQKKFVYGLTEIARPAIRTAMRVSNPGCFATAVNLGLHPFASEGYLEGTVIADAKTGSSGAGAKPLSTTHHPRRANSFFAYKAFQHQHLPEILQCLENGGRGWDLVFQVHSAPMVRGIFASLYLSFQEEMTDQKLEAIFKKYYGNEFFVRLVEGSPDVNWVKHTNFADIGWAAQGRHAVIFVAIDNLVKGAAGQAVQNMNLMFGLDERTGLQIPGSHP